MGWQSRTVECSWTWAARADRRRGGRGTSPGPRCSRASSVQEDQATRHRDRICAHALVERISQALPALRVELVPVPWTPEDELPGGEVVAADVVADRDWLQPAVRERSAVVGARVAQGAVVARRRPHDGYRYAAHPDRADVAGPQLVLREELVPHSATETSPGSRGYVSSAFWWRIRIRSDSGNEPGRTWGAVSAS